MPILSLIFTLIFFKLWFIFLKKENLRAEPDSVDLSLKHNSGEVH